MSSGVISNSTIGRAAATASLWRGASSVMRWARQQLDPIPGGGLNMAQPARQRTRGGPPGDPLVGAEGRRSEQHHAEAAVLSVR